MSDNGLSALAGTLWVVSDNPALTVRQHMALQLAGRRFKYEAARESAARQDLGWSAARFWQVVNVLLERPAAEAAYPQLVRRQRRLREARAAARRGVGQIVGQRAG